MRVASAAETSMSGHSDGPITIHKVKDKGDTREFVELAFRLNR
eukprot:gene3081-3972_t